MAKEKWFITESEFDDDQHKIRDLNPNKSFTIQGCAGSGKTILALWKAKFHHENGDNYLLIVFTSTLKRFIEDGVRDLGLEASRILSFSKWEKRNFPTADYIIVDESQDFSSSEILKMKEKAQKSIMFFGDTIQQLYPKKIGSSESTVSMVEISTLTGAPLRTLMKNYRLPKTIGRFAQRIPKLTDDLEKKCVKAGTTLPSVIKFSSKHAELDFIIETIKRENLIDVGILVPTNEEAEMVNKYFDSKGMLSEVKYSIKDSWDSSLDFVTSNPKIMTYHSSKGVQFETVFVPFCEVDDQFYRNSLYVGTTRPFKNLYITFSNRLSAFINGIPKSIYQEINKDKAETDLPF